MPIELLLVLLLFPVPGERFDAYAARLREAEAARAACSTLEAEVQRQGDAIAALERAGKTAQARALLRRTHAAMEELTRCRKRQKGMERDLGELARKARREAEEELDRALAAGLPVREAYARMAPLLERLRALPPPSGCAVPAYDEVVFSSADPGPVLQEKRLLVADILLRLDRQGEADAARLDDLRAERDLRRQLVQFMTGLEVEGGAGAFDPRPSADENRERLLRLDEEVASCERALAVGEAARHHWRERAAELERLAEP